MSKEKLTEKVLSEGMNPCNTHSDLLAKTEKKPDWLSFTEAVERITDNFMANRNGVFDELRSDLVNPYIFLSNCIFRSIPISHFGIIRSPISGLSDH
ncbi:hypothetical protein VCSRO193_3329 [Vibrio cholerae]|uniref:hypothetical protein n=1 Tax=Vibrio cholerae TaxID=666 RepID=UPI00208BF931|nr:hypothetical protein VCSRO193_3329 [Vibrio cholerae]